MVVSPCDTRTSLYDVTTHATRGVYAGGAAALRLPDVGGLSVGKRAHFAVLDAPSYVHLAYRPGVPLISQVVGGGLSGNRSPAP